MNKKKEDPVKDRAALVTSAKKEYGGLDRFRMAAAILVVAIHTAPLVSYSETGDMILTGILARVAVPFFFMVTGFFLLSKERLTDFSYRNFFLKNAKLYALAVLLYLPLNFYAGHFSEGDSFTGFLQDLVFDGTFYHLWYFPGVLLGTGLLILLIRRLSGKGVLTVVLTLYLIGVLGDSYYGIASQWAPIASFYEFLFHFFDYTRNGLFFAPVFLFLGARLADKKESPVVNVSLRNLWISLSLMVLEGFLLHTFSHPRHDSMYMMLLPSMYFLFQTLIALRGKGHPEMRSIAAAVYVIHPWCIVLIRGIAKFTGTQSLLVNNSLIHFLLTALLSLLLSCLFRKLWISARAIEKGALAEEDPTGRAWSEIHLPSLQHNVKELQSLLPEECKIMAVVKANAYGHGDCRIAAELQRIGITSFAVASLKEGIRLRQYGIKGSILILGYTIPEDAEQLNKYGLTQTVVDYAYAEALDRMGQKINVHLKVDTGMHRLGEDWGHLERFSQILKFNNLTIHGIYTHLCSADSLSADDIFYTTKQIRNFYQVVRYLLSKGCSLPEVHIQSSYGVLNYPQLECTHARLGIALYGCLSEEKAGTRLDASLKPLLSVRSRVSIVKELSPKESLGYGRTFIAETPMKIAGISVGYADGVPRDLTGGYVLINGKRAPIIGRICMDQLTVDVSEIPEVRQGDIATIIGRDGEEVITAEQVAGWSGTIANEILSRLGNRLERIYKEK